MFRRLVFENSAALFTLVAFITAVTIYVTFAWRALRMKRSQIAHFENLPFEIETPGAPSPSSEHSDDASGTVSTSADPRPPTNAGTLRVL